MPSLRRLLAASLTGATAWATALSPAVAAAPTAETTAPGDDGRVVLSSGHLDLAARLTTDGRLEFAIKDGTAGGEAVWRDPHDVVLHFDARHAWEIPDAPDGVVPHQLGRAGDTVWTDRGVTHDSSLLWPGWNTEEVLPADLVDGGSVTADFAEVTGPDGFHLGGWADDPQLGTVIRLDVDGTRPEPGAVELRPNTHAHPLWFFTAEGVHRIGLQMSATLASGQRVSDVGTVTAVVGDDVDPWEVELPGPGEPGEPGEPGGPGGPEEPGEPEEPGGPQEPEQPEQPEQPGNPEEPEDGDAGTPGGTGDADGTSGAGGATGAGAAGAGPGPAGGELAATGGGVVPLALGAALLVGVGVGGALLRRSRLGDAA
ncbi:choice-of-anchor M domain-containing protein [Streptomyces sp. 4N509B]|uniref:choice-of-anchor M domain-containing protein n=1 Tax=Streptomyces sp. 4N509B TaxID=3457413 RepID=UPI003FD3D791